MDIIITQNKLYEQFENILFIISEEDAKVIGKAELSEQDALIQKAIYDGDFTGKKEKLLIMRTHEEGKPKRLFLVGLGKSSEIDVEGIRRSVALAVKKVKEMKLDELSILMPECEKITNEQVITGIVEGAILGDYEPSMYKTEKAIKLKKFEIIYTKDNVDKLKQVIAKTRIICANTLLVRDLVNENAETKNPQAMAEKIRNTLKKLKIKVTTHDEKALKKIGLEMIIAVGRASQFPPALVILEYNGNKSSKEKYALIGKGITFDSGGLDLKPGTAIDTMRSDMAGAAAVFGTIKTLAELKIKKNVVGVLPLCENSVGSRSYKPGDILKAYNGKTVEIENTDAEGRLILADALAYAEKNLKPTKIISIATLTGAEIIALGEHAAGMMTKEDGFATKLYESGERTHERVWQLPMYEEYREEMKSDFADLKNINYKGKYGTYAGAIMGAIFLEKFVEKTPYVHLDIAGPAWFEKERAYNTIGGTGFGVRLLTDFFLNN